MVRHHLDKMTDLINQQLRQVIIAQDSIQRFLIKPLGVYGSKGEIVRLLRSIAVIDDNTCVLLMLIISYL